MRNQICGTTNTELLGKCITFTTTLTLKSKKSLFQRTLMAKTENRTGSYPSSSTCTTELKAMRDYTVVK